MLKNIFQKMFRKKSLQSVDSNRGWIPVIQESVLGAFQTNNPLSLANVFTHPTVYACITQIAFDIGKLRLNITEKAKQGISVPVNVPRFSRLLYKPNKYQTRQKFIESWCTCLQTYGNTYILKERDIYGKIIGLHVLDPNRVTPLISDNGDVFYRLRKDTISTVDKDITAAPASEIIHDRLSCLFHPLVGVSPLYASDMAISTGLYIEKHSANFFSNNAQPSGIITAPVNIKKEKADLLTAAWEEKFSGNNAGKVAILTNGLTYAPIAENAVDSALVEQFKLSDEKICSVFKVPPYKIHVGQLPTYQESETLDRKYYSDCLQRLIEAIESLLDEGLGMTPKYHTEFNLKDLMRMDVSLKMKTTVEGVKGGIYSPNEGRREFNLPPVKGGHTPYLQQQNFSLAALDERDRNDPFNKNQQTTQNNRSNVVSSQEEDQTDKGLSLLFKKDISGVYRD